MAEIILNDLVKFKLKEITNALYEEAYFGFLADAENYVNNIFNFIITIPTIKHKVTFNNKYGSFFCSYKHNNNTTWYISFDMEEDKYIIKNITNNHLPDYPLFIKNK